MVKSQMKAMMIFLGFVACALTTCQLTAQEKNDGTLLVHIRNKELSMKVGDEIVVQTTAGDEIGGTVVGLQDQQLIIAGKFGELKFSLDAIREVHFLKRIDDKTTSGRWRHRDPLSTRTFFSATGQTLQKGEKSFENYYLFFNSLNYGVTNHIMINAGMSLFPSKNFIKNNVYLIGAKVKFFDTGNFRVAMGGQYISLPFVKEIDASFFYPYAIVGIGSPDNAQLNVSYARLIYVGKDTEIDILSTLNINGHLRISNSIKMIGEVIYPLETKNDDRLAYLWGIRFMTKNIGVDLGFLNRTKSKIFPGFPLVSFSYNWQ